MKEIKCRCCNEVIFTEHEPLNGKSGSLKIITKLQYHADRDCNSSIYLTCDSGHIEKYYCKLKEISEVSAV